MTSTTRVIASLVVAGMATVGLGTVAQAHVNSVTITARCSADGLSRTLTATITNSWAQDEDAIVGGESSAHFTLAHLHILRKGTGVMTATIPGDRTGAVQLTILARWTDHFSARNSAGLTIGAHCP